MAINCSYTNRQSPPGLGGRKYLKLRVFTLVIGVVLPCVPATILTYLAQQAMALVTNSMRLLRLGPALISSMTLMFAIDEHLIFGTWVQDPIRSLANSALPAWWTRGGLRWQWVLIILYPINYILGIVNLLVPGDQPDSTLWYAWGLFFSIAHMFFAPTALHRIAAIEEGAPRGNAVLSMEAWLRMNWVRAWTTDLPAWTCFITAALKTL